MLSRVNWQVLNILSGVLVTIAAASGLYFKFLVLSGPINEKMARRVDFALAFPLPLVINSGGGDAEIAYAISQKIHARKKSVYIFGKCASACAEYFLPAAKHVYASSDVLIGYHTSDYFIYEFEDSSELYGVDYCGFHRLAWLNRLYDEKGWNKKFYLETMSRLKYKYVGREFTTKIVAGKLCISNIPYSVADVWFPTSEQLEKQLGLKIGHGICADRESCWKKEISGFAPPGERYVVGDYMFKPRPAYVAR